MTATATVCLGEGASAVVLKTGTCRRGAGLPRWWADLTDDACHITAPSEDGDGIPL